MPSAFIQMLRSRGFAVCVHAGLWLLLYLAVRGLGGETASFHEANFAFRSRQNPPPMADLSSIFSTGQWAKLRLPTNTPNPFFTRYFVPPPSPAPPPPPTTRKIEITYQGFYQTADRPRDAVIKVAKGFVIVPVGAPVATNLYVAEATFQSLLLTNPAAETNLLPLNVKKQIEVPIR